MSGKATIFHRTYLLRVLRGECEIWSVESTPWVLSTQIKKSDLVLNLGPPFLGEKVDK
jgi:hypothetical protein